MLSFHWLFLNKLVDMLLFLLKKITFPFLISLHVQYSFILSPFLLHLLYHDGLISGLRRPGLIPSWAHWVVFLGCKHYSHRASLILIPIALFACFSQPSLGLRNEGPRGNLFDRLWIVDVKLWNSCHQLFEN